MPEPATVGGLLIPPHHYRPPGRDAPMFAAKTKQAKVQRMLEQLGGEVAGLEPAVMRSVLPVLHEARRELRTALSRWLREKDGALRYTAQEYRRSLVQLERAIGEMKRLQPALRFGLEEGGQTAGYLAVEHLEFELARFAQVFGETIRPIQLEPAAIIAHGRKTMIPRFRTSAARYAGNVVVDIRRQLAVGVARGETYSQLTNRLRRLGGPRGLVSLRGVKGEPGAAVEEIAEGLFRRYRHWSERVVRTEMQQAYSVQEQASIDQLNADERELGEPEYKKRWDASADNRLCPHCYRMHGQIVAADENFYSEQFGAVPYPPLHPSCRCMHTPWLERWGDTKSPPRRRTKT